MLDEIYKPAFSILAVLTLCGFIFAQSPAEKNKKIIEAIEKDGCALISQEKVKVCKFDYKFEGKTVEALIFRPVAEGKYPGVMLIPGFQGTPQSQFLIGDIFARFGFVAMSVGTAGFGKTELKPDFLGKNTIKAYKKGFEIFQKDAFVEKNNIGIFGYSRGAIATSLLITKLKDVKAAVLGGGMYDLKKAYDDLTLEGIKENIKAETGATKKAFKERSAIFKVKKIKCPVLIVHGGKDLNAPTDQAYLLRDKLKESGKQFEFQILENHDHGSIGGDMMSLIFDFMSRKLKGKPLEVKFR